MARAVFILSEQIPMPVTKALSVSTTKSKPQPSSRRASDRELAKLGLNIALGALVLTGLSRTRTSRKLHILAGGALIGLSVWHHMLYAPAGNGSGNASSREGDAS
jgi:hypothetical protein